METQLKVELCILFIILVIARLLFLIHKITTGHSKYASNKRIEPCKTIICIGSGGHTTEMISLLSTLDFRKYSPRYYIIATTDTTSLTKIESLETSKSTQLREKDYFIQKIPRSRVVQQSYFTSIFTTIFSILYSIPLVLKIRPDLILCNGPGTCIPICVIGFLLKSFFITDTKIVFIESFCRTKTLSLTGKILVYLADNFIVQWPNLRKKLKRADYIDITLQDVYKLTWGGYSTSFDVLEQIEDIAFDDLELKESQFLFNIVIIISVLLVTKIFA